MAIIKCPECGHQVSDKAATCPSCGVGIQGKITKCPECGEIVLNDQILCPNCHSPLISTNNNDTEKSEPSQSHKVATVEPNSDTNGEGNKNEKKKKSYTPWVVSFVIALAVVFVGLYFYKTTQMRNELEAYENAMMSNEPAVLQNYLDIYADAPSEHRDSIQSHLEMLKKVDSDWTNAVVSNSKAAILRYMQLYPNSLHNVEAKLKIDSIDWMEATQKNTIEAYQKYIDEHADGMYIDQAHDAYTLLDSKKVNAEDKANISAIFTSFFNALANNDEATLVSCVDIILTSFLHKENANKNDVIEYMHKIHNEAHVENVEFRLNNDWIIEKIDRGNGSFAFKVNFSIDKITQLSGDSNSSFDTFKVKASVSPDNKISELNMQRIVQ
ncbi:MAG: zinc ribbon domain-containing protein [Prevotella sp.]|nr:zinc ribbon domain-containing protein [Prevotella sp.]